MEPTRQCWPKPSKLTVEDLQGDDPAKAWWAGNSEIYLDGVKVWGCVMADEEAGTLEKYIPNEDPRWKSEFLHATYWPTETLHGKVEIRMKQTKVGEGVPLSATDLTVETFTGADGDHWWRVRHGNGNIVASSGEGYRNASHRDKMVAKLFPNLPVRSV